MIKYPAKIVREEDGKYSVFFLGDGMDGCMTFGMSLDDAKKNAQEALDLYIEYLYSEKRRIPIPSDIEGNDIYYFEPNFRIQFALKLRDSREKISLSQSEMAARMGILPAQYQRLENPKKTNPTLETIYRIEEALHSNVFLKQ